MDIPTADIAALRREKYNDDAGANMHADIARLMRGEPLAFVIGTQPFLGLTIHLDSHPLIPRPETEWWAEKLCERIGDRQARVLDLCAGSGAIGLSVLKHCKNAHVTFTDIRADHARLIEKNIAVNGLDASRATVLSGDLFEPVIGHSYDFIATNPPYIPSGRTLPESVTAYEPAEALYGGSDGLGIIRRIAREYAAFLNTPGELWLECDSEHAYDAKTLFPYAQVLLDHYDRPRLVLALKA